MFRGICRELHKYLWHICANTLMTTRQDNQRFSQLYEKYQHAFLCFVNLVVIHGECLDFRLPSMWKSGHSIICGWSHLEAEEENRTVAAVTGSMFKMLISCSLLLCHRRNLNVSQGRNTQVTWLNKLRFVVQNNAIFKASRYLQDALL